MMLYRVSQIHSFIVSHVSYAYPKSVVLERLTPLYTTSRVIRGSFTTLPRGDKNFTGRFSHIHAQGIRSRVEINARNALYKRHVVVCAMRSKGSRKCASDDDNNTETFHLIFIVMLLSICVINVLHGVIQTRLSSNCL